MKQAVFFFFFNLHGNLPFPTWNLAKPGEQQNCPVRPMERTLTQDTTLYMLSRYRGDYYPSPFTLWLSEGLLTAFSKKSQWWVDSAQPIVLSSHQTTIISLQRHIDKYITSHSLDFHDMPTEFEKKKKGPNMSDGAGSFLLEATEDACLCDNPPSSGPTLLLSLLQKGNEAAALMTRAAGC